MRVVKPLMLTGVIASTVAVWLLSRGRALADIHSAAGSEQRAIHTQAASGVVVTSPPRSGAPSPGAVTDPVPAPAQNAAQLEDYLGKVILRVGRHPDTADDALELGLSVIANVGSKDDLGSTVRRQRLFTDQIRKASETAKPAAPAELPRDVVSLLDQIRDAPNSDVRKELASSLVGKLSGLPGPVQREAIEQLRGAAAE